MSNSDNKNNPNNKPLKDFYQQLTGFLTLRLIVDKLIDFILIFIGLYAALSLESKIKDNESEEEYLVTLKNTYIETTTNRYFINRFESELKQSAEYLDQIYYNFYLDADKNLEDPPPYLWNDYLEYEQNHYNALDVTNFKNKELLSKILNLQEFYVEADLYWDKYIDATMEISENYIYHNYYEHWPTNSDYRTYYLYSKSLKGKKIIRESFETGDYIIGDLLSAIDNELQKNYQIDVYSLMNLQEISLLAHHAEKGEYFADAYKHLSAGIRKLENQSNKTSKDYKKLNDFYDDMISTIYSNYTFQGTQKLYYVMSYIIPEDDNKKLFNSPSFKTAIDYCKKSRQLINDELFLDYSDEYQQQEAYDYNIAAIYGYLGEMDSAYYYLNKGVDFAHMNNRAFTLSLEEVSFPNCNSSLSPDTDSTFTGAESLVKYQCIYDSLDDRMIKIMNKIEEYQKTIVP